MLVRSPGFGVGFPEALPLSRGGTPDSLSASAATAQNPIGQRFLDADLHSRCSFTRCFVRRENPLNVSVGQHFIAGAWREGADGFDLRQRVEPFEPVGTWPRADEALIVEALEASRAGRASWLALSAVERAACLRRVLEHLLANHAWSSHLGSFLGVQPGEIAGEQTELERLIRGEPSGADSGASRPARTAELGAEVGVVFARWTDFVSGLYQRIATQLASDRGVVVLSDNRWPVSADALGAAISAAGMPTGVVSIVHGLSAPLRDTLIAMAASVAPDESEGHLLLRAQTVPFTLDLGGHEQSNRSIVVREECELAQTALEVVDQAFGRASSLSGQRPGRVARVICNVRVFSRFCEHLLTAIEGSVDVKQPIPQIDNEAINAVRALWNLGLDEGATLIFGGECFEAAPGSRARDPRVWPAIYSNVDPEMALSRMRQTVPVLCLIRAESDEAAEQLALDLG